MKKSKSIIFFLLIFSLMGVGYAAWMETVSIEAKVSTGDMKVQFVESDFPVELNTDESELVEVTRDENKLSIKCENIFPGVCLSIPAQIENKGTIPVIFDDVEVTFNDVSEELLEALEVSMLNYELFSSADKEYNFYSSEVLSNIKLKNLKSELRKLFKGVRLNPGEKAVLNSGERKGESIEAYIDLILPDGADNNTQEKSLNFEIKITWKQFNN